MTFIEGRRLRTDLGTPSGSLFTKAEFTAEDELCFLSPGAEVLGCLVLRRMRPLSQSGPGKMGPPLVPAPSLTSVYTNHRVGRREAEV